MEDNKDKEIFDIVRVKGDNQIEIKEKQEKQETNDCNLLEKNNNTEKKGI
jgi:hypothetical protein